MDPDASSGNRMPIPVGSYRVASPILRPGPLVTRPGFFPKLQSYIAPIRDRTEQILDLHQLTDEDTEVAVLNRQKYWAHDTGIATLLIIHRWKEDSHKTWPPAVREIVDFVDEYLVECDETLQIDMTAPQRVIQKHLTPAPSLPGLDWPELRSTIHQKLDTYEATRSHVTAIGIFRLGFYPDPHLNPTTVYISLEDDSDETQWIAVSRNLKSYIHSQGWDFVVHMEHNVVSRCAFQLNLPTGGSLTNLAEALKSNLIGRGEYEYRVNLGASIGAAHYPSADGELISPDAGTLGCYIEIRIKGSSEWKKCGLTNYHITRSWETDYTMSSKVRCYPVTLESPARIKHNYTIWDLNDRIRANREGEPGWREEEFRHGAIKAAKLERDRAAKLAFFDHKKNDCGSVLLASGFDRATPEGGRLDWAVIEVDSPRIGENRLPTEEAWKAKYGGWDTPYAKTFGGLLQQPPGSFKDKTMAPGASVWKVGPTSGPTTGTFNEYKVECTIKDDVHAAGIPRSYFEEFITVDNDRSGQGQSGRFCGPGDPGSVVFDARGQAIGLLFGGQVPSQTAGYGLVTPIEDVFEDIKASSKGRVEDIRIASS
ncbi:hypothetical protein B0J15DRAFT_558323 [Fusarium solani]|jgi:hypothetical protein|uniref:Uncharacterized protein n=1 Tax=Fusarium solani TaxID=169388 RepID=A0A9P9RF35_FUSSL|nr:uncharacterized protein B0J15DRAFT_558323 [Fusarium solani]KAH7276173.1 hypothetical protein B0J15DRAFT_558323 [Fusarium solani]